MMVRDTRFRIDARPWIDYGRSQILSKPKTWGEFERNWLGQGDFYGVLGMLHSGYKFAPYAPVSKIMACDDLAVGVDVANFYLYYARCIVYPEMAAVAKRVLVRRILGEGRISCVELVTAPLHASLVSFLRTPDPDLFEPPFPYLIMRYLLGLHVLWLGEGMEHWNQGAQEMHHELLGDGRYIKAQGHAIILAMLAWGWASYLRAAKDDFVETMIQRFLNERLPKWDPRYTHQSMIAELRDLRLFDRGEKENLDLPGFNRIIDARAYFRLLQFESKVPYLLSR